VRGGRRARGNAPTQTEAASVRNTKSVQALLRPEAGAAKSASAASSISLASRLIPEDTLGSAGLRSGKTRRQKKKK